MAKIYEFRGREDVYMPVSVFDVAKAFLSRESMTHKKLQKLCYYAQAWYLALYKKKLIEEHFEAWVHGPVCPELYHEYKEFGWNNIPLESHSPLDRKLDEFIGEVYKTYGQYDGDELEMLTHMEQPWKQAREGLEDWEPSHNILDEKLMEKYYWGLYEANQND